MRSHSELISGEKMLVNCATGSNHYYFSFAQEFVTLVLAYMFDSLVRVLRRGDNNNLVSVNYIIHSKLHTLTITKSYSCNDKYYYFQVYHQWLTKRQPRAWNMPKANPLWLHLLLSLPFG